MESVFLCGSSNSDATENLLKASSVIELVHVATLVHDDILDNASIRRGNPTLHSLHSKHTSILLGDALFSFALEIATTFPDTTVCRIVSKATRDTCTGEIDQNLFVNDFEMSLDKYYSIIQNKTGALFSASCSIGAYLSGASSIVMDLVCDFGTSLGVNYQIYDDLVDTFGDKSSFDKTLGTDISSGKVTLPIIKLLESLSGNERNSVVSDLSQKTQNVDFLNYLGELFVKNSIHQACFDELQKQLSNSRSIASNIPEAMLSKNLSKNLFPNCLALNENNHHCFYVSNVGTDKDISKVSQPPLVVNEVNRVVGLVRDAKKGSLEAFDTLTIMFRERLYSVIYNMTLNHDDAADLTQDAFVKAFRSLSKFKEKSSFFTWIYRIGVNLTLTYLKKRKARKFFSFDYFMTEGLSSKETEKFSSKESNSVRTTLLNELHEKLNEALLRLSDKHRTIVVLYEIDGLSHREIASIMKCTEGTVRSRLHYAKLQLQSFLSEYLK